MRPCAVPTQHGDRPDRVDERRRAVRLARHCCGATGTFDDEGNMITGHWDALDDDSNWRPWMEITLTREAR